MFSTPAQRQMSDAFSYHEGLAGQKFNEGMEAFQNAAAQNSFFSPLKQRRLNKQALHASGTADLRKQIRNGTHIFGQNSNQSMKNANKRRRIDSAQQVAMFSIKEDSFAAATKKQRPTLSRVGCDLQNQQHERGNFDKVKRKLTFEEDYTSMASDGRLIFPYEGGVSKNPDANPFLKLLDSAESVPTFSSRNN